MESKGYYSSEGVNYEKIIPVYQEAFRGWPWYEVSKCADDNKQKRCQDGLSRLALGQACGTCLNVVSIPAYEPAELVDRFNDVTATRPSLWYREDIDQRAALAALAWRADAVGIAEKKYRDSSEMSQWMQDRLGDDEFVWLDEIFADKRVRPNANLKNFKAIAEGFMELLGRDSMAFRTINPALVRAAQRDFEASVVVSERLSAVPDRRDFVIIKREEK